MKKIGILLIVLFVFWPISSYALNESYVDIAHEYVNVEVKEEVVNIYFFYGDGCPHCAKEEKVLDQLQEKYQDRIKIYRYETWSNNTNKQTMLEVKKRFGETVNGAVPFTAIGEKSYSGYSEWVGSDLEKQIRLNLELDDIEKEDTVVEENKVEIPFLGKVDASDTAVSVAAVILGFVDGFNPCAMWVLLFIISMLIGMNDRKKMFILGFTFLFTSGLFYFFSLLGINLVLDFVSITQIRSLIGLVAIAFGIYNLYVYFRDRQLEDGCQVVDEKKRKSIMRKVKKIKNANNFFLALGGIVLLAISVNMVELACSAGFPMIFSEVMVANGVRGIARIIYLIVYVIFYMIDDMVVFTISVCTLTIAGMTTKYNKLIKIIGGILMLLMGILLIFKPEWIMLNF